MTSKGGNILYLCRQCGEVFSEGHSPDWLASLAYTSLGLVLNPKIPSVLEAKMFCIHHCEEGPSGLRGLADLIGANADTEKSKEN